jgi:hypothetical protein
VFAAMMMDSDSESDWVRVEVVKDPSEVLLS